MQRTASPRGIFAALAGLTLTAAAPSSRAAPAASLGEVTVEAGGHARQDTPVIFQLPKELAGKPLVLKGPGAARAPLDVEPDGTAVFVLRKLGKGRKVRLAIQEEGGTAAPEGITVVEKDDTLSFSIAGVPVLRYQMKARPPRAGLSPQAIRGGYLHPIHTPSGLLVTDDYALKHAAHHGIWTAWQSSELEGHKLSFWGSTSARLDFEKLESARSGRVAAGFVARHAGMELSKPPRRVLDEEWRVRLYRTHAEAAPYYVFDLDWTDQVVGSSPLKVLEYRYGGLAVRGHADWDGAAGATFVTSEGKDRLAGEGSTGRWVHMGGAVSGKAVGIATLVHPENFRAPQPLRLHPNEPYFSVAPAKAGPFSIEPGKPFRSRYRFVVADGPADRALLERLWQDYAKPPVVTVKLRKPIAAATAPSTTISATSR